jgi:hypothetical protein
MKTSILLVPLVLATALAWGREQPPKPAHTSEFALPAKGRRHDYKQSLKKPFQYNNEIPFWDQHGSMKRSFLILCHW